jgi:hypothetical protein
MTRPIMTQRTFVYLIAGLLSIVSVARAEAITVVFPAGFEDTEGNTLHNDPSPYPDSTETIVEDGFRIQELHPASEFLSLGSGPFVISSMAFRPDVSVTGPVFAEWQITALNLSTTTTQLGTIFDNNYGTGGFTTVLSGIVQLETDGVPRPGGLPHDFDYVFDFQTPYVYDPQQGNLLQESIVANGVPPTNTWQDATDSESRLVLTLDDDAEFADITLDEMTIKQFTFASEPLLGDLNLDSEVNGLDVDPFVEVLLSGPYQLEADMNEDQVVNGLDVDPFVAAVVGGTQQIPEPSTLLLCLLALAVVGGWRKWKRAT